ncbi:NADH dehydrogenase/NADH:ubiquinone oxidoreductase 75 kD subunit (chain G) (NuoG) (PDB:1C4A) [Commensalibacter communis]|uniref:NADH-quinone oxidoreductase n=1 Tax=Commensalibacter communis TaxID=2972786 RepID=A0A9W4X942_9PROT|nr:NADH-quinone oxidoreductase subunit NuoG [Commensalibacter communis]CAI3929231.1 NADH dehydrogenase/NADH:ubiquinone oxidoreductase 75 kD subunit (chain G) (NuoG) (PDB:1C4A) [Commensalibacter communis]CAI3929828.1 NADH dehydrogenase/NADH:ubiquinone oxidoreductase 75 kD subunit (chain G) (NuoG) (PDB:1C4A) [Commensalibacter communis]CAI3931649.1 NADH dehydrogenase/NADH:ubiquinone oxidoreductase 75 kD subunit (chain G) (NuoG) (PDB:1C4A) [Commensalibacter communis]CAI3933172.1 NADH dehydrogenase/
MAKVIVDGIPVEVPNGSSVLQACEAAGKEIPRFCYHDKLSVAGNCRMCMVEITGARKPLVSSCSHPVMEGMHVTTDSETIRTARRSTMELLLINHPLDCPICDQGGECDLQDQAVGYGRDCSRYTDEKRAVVDKYMGPLIRTVMTRCIQCTRCIRFTNEIAGTAELGGIYRGTSLEITPFIEQSLVSELSGNLIDVCPVGALTSKPTAFHYRSWELKNTDSIDVVDAVGTNIMLQIRGNEVMRVLPRKNDDVNEEWLSDKGRFSLDGLKRRRLDRPWIKKNGKLVEASWTETIQYVADKLKTVAADRIGAIAGDLCDAESMLALKHLVNGLGSANTDCRQDNAYYDISERGNYVFNSSIAGIEDADALLVIGSFPRQEAPVLNARIRKRWLSLTEQFPIAYIGELPDDPTYKIDHLGESPELINELLAGNHAFVDILKNAKRPMIILGHGALIRPDSKVIFEKTMALANAIGAVSEDWNGFNILHHAASRVAGLDLGFIPQGQGKDVAAMINGGVDVLWMLGADEVDISTLSPECFVIYQGHHGERAASRADVILPGATYTEKSGTYVNTEGRVQRSFRAICPPGEAKEEWSVICSIGQALAVEQPYQNLETLRQYMTEVNPVFAQCGLVKNSVAVSVGDGAQGNFEKQPLTAVISDYFLTNSISRASLTMNECSKLRYAPSAEAAE